ncbi:hypothetical protein EVJ58_g4822 [Rhodofomes roseus]|uniref:Uncharacterized protein n=2 Tax=Rhodofomes roseus TaxID=34475 RepID=A0A4Y9YGH1_9APHY|nr:hypothetical protein EVJ58_g4822 [Rhodofomes roseus]
MGLTFADIQSLSREESALYPSYDPLPVLSEYSEEERRIAELQVGFTTRLRQSAYYVVEQTKSRELPRYSDKYRPSAAKQPTLRRQELHQPFFPQEILEGYFNPKKRKISERKGPKKRINLNELGEDGEDAEKEDEEHSDVGSQAVEEDYDVDEEYDNDYAENYFDNGEGDDPDGLGDGGGNDEGGGGGDDLERILDNILNLRKVIMRRNSVLALLALSVPATVSACEGECIVKITNAYVGNYTTPVDAVMRILPLLSAYDAAAYIGMETAVFPRFFHGKCAVHGADPPGCPNPDCPVVCGTPGSMVHFFPTLRYLAYNETRARIEAAADPEGATYKLVEQNVLNAANDHRHTMRLGRIMPRSTASKSKTKTGSKAMATSKGYPGFRTAPVSPGSRSSSSPVASSTSAVPAAEAAPDDHVFVPVFVRTDLMDSLSSGSALSQLSALGDASQLVGGSPLSDLNPDKLSELDPVGHGQLIPRAPQPSKTTTSKTSRTTNTGLSPLPVFARTGLMDSLSSGDALNQLSDLSDGSPLSDLSPDKLSGLDNGQLIPRAPQPSKTTPSKTSRTTTTGLSPTAAAAMPAADAFPTTTSSSPSPARTRSRPSRTTSRRCSRRQAPCSLSWETSMKEYILTFP